MEPVLKTEAQGKDADATAAKRNQDFERYLAGASVGKAGLDRDQTEINRIIAEASKGSKFYLDQQRRDERLTEQIEALKDRRDERLITAQLERLEAQADRMLLEVEATRDLSQTIVHVDLDAFYAAVETKRDPSLIGKAFGVGKGVLCTASYEARKFGCRSGMAGFIAKALCPHIILVPLHFELYSAASKSVREVLMSYDDNLMMAGVDEGYLNITPYMSSHNMSASEVVSQMRAEVESKTGMTISAGIAPNRMLAKIASDLNKPNGQYELEFDRAAIVRFMRDLPVRKLPGFGRVTERILEGLGVKTCGDVYAKRAELLLMDDSLGFRGLCKAYLGVADNHVEPHKREERKSVGVESTFREKSNEEDILAKLESIAEELEKDLANLKFAGRTVTVKYKLHTFESKTRARTVKKNLATKEEILPIAVELIRKEFPLRIRLLGIRMTTLQDLAAPEKPGIQGYFTQPGSSRTTTSGPEQSGAPTADETITNIIELDPGPRVGGLQCPSCHRELQAETTNEELNEHLDVCLNDDLLAEMYPGSTSRSGSGSPRKRSESCDPVSKGSKKARTSKSGGRGKTSSGKGKGSTLYNYFTPAN